MKNNISKILIMFISAFAILFINYNDVLAYDSNQIEMMGNYPNTQDLPYANYFYNSHPSYYYNPLIDPYYQPYNQPSIQYRYVNTQLIPVNTQPIPSIINNYYYQNSTPQTLATTSNTATTKTTTTSNVKNTVKTDNDIDNLPPVVKSNNEVNKDDLTALSLKGKGGFMPSSIWQWILVIILILVVIIISRLLLKKSNIAYNSQHMEPTY